ncbi:hypothetical protein BS78_04G011500 [Paspalum vaginatum]|nr:hypothetical protein BS78_04G011500 [Paspalum vaginatum]
MGGYMSPVNDAYKKKDLLPAAHRIRFCQLASKISSFSMVDPWDVTLFYMLSLVSFCILYNMNVCVVLMGNAERLSARFDGSFKDSKFSVQGWCSKVYIVSFFLLLQLARRIVVFHILLDLMDIVLAYTLSMYGDIYLSIASGSCMLSSCFTQTQ